jgi:hypothetical protein
MRTRFLTNPVFSIETGELLSHEGEEWLDDSEIPIRFDRSIQGAAKNNEASANSLAGRMGVQAGDISSSVIPGLEQQATHPTGFDPTQKNRMLVAGAEAAGGAGAGAGGAATLEKLRTRSPSGFSAALDEASRIKQRQLSGNALGVENEDARLALQRQNEAQRMLQGFYNTDTGNQLKAMGLADEDLNTALNAGKSGWLQNTEGILNTAANLGSSAAGVKKAWG